MNALGGIEKAENYQKKNSESEHSDKGGTERPGCAWGRGLSKGLWWDSTMVNEEEKGMMQEEEEARSFWDEQQWLRPKDSK